MNAIQPIHLITGNEPTHTFPLWLLVTALVILTLLIAVVWATFAHRARIARNPDEYAFRALAHQLRLAPSLAELIRRLAPVHAATPPVALLLSGHALHTALASYQQHNPSRRDRRLIEKLREAFGLSNPDAS